MRELPICSEQDQAGDVLIQPPHRAQTARRRGDQIQHGGFPAIARGGEHARGLKEHQMRVPGRSRRRSLRAHLVRVRHNASRVALHFPIYPHFASRDQALGLRARKTQRSYAFIQPHGISPLSSYTIPCFCLRRKALKYAKPLDYGAQIWYNKIEGIF